ncbi:MAG TPA: NAD(P)-binding domain-containing protein [Candidatus Binatia bacterium]|nr:NAD(P)-binding domain-containing protein [Candidatus Binatia bacterium]
MAELRRPRFDSPLASATVSESGLAAPHSVLRREGRSRRDGSDWPWVVAARAGRATAEERARFLGRIQEGGLDRGRVVVATCHRVELFGIGEPPEPETAAGFPWRGLEVGRGPDAARHALRLAVGLESVVLGEEQVLGQVREAHAAARRRGPLDPRLDRLFQIALRVGRAARADGRPTTDGLARRAVAALAHRLGSPDGRLGGRRILVVGAGTMGRLLAVGVLRAGAELILASRHPARARALLEAVESRGEALDLEGAAVRWSEGRLDGVLVALAGPWPVSAREIDRAGGPRRLAPVVDLSAPSALPEGLRKRLGRGFIGIDDLAEESGDATPVGAGDSAGPADPTAERVFRDRAEALVSEGLAAYRSWLVARAAGETIRALQDEAEAIRLAELEALFRRLPDLDPRARDLINLHSRRTVARLLHPLVRELRGGDPGDGARKPSGR